MPKTYRTRIDLRWTDIDLQGHVNNAKFIEFAQDGRVRFMTEVTGAIFERESGAVVRFLTASYERQLHGTSGREYLTPQ